MRKKCDELRAGWQEKFGHEVFARAGVNSGNAVVGNMGSKHKYNYTVMGDMVNLASRLEGANKAYGTFLMISETTVAKLGDAIDVRELDRIAVKGKDVPVTVYEVLDEVGADRSGVDRACAQVRRGARDATARKDFTRRDRRCSRRTPATSRPRSSSSAASISSRSRRLPTGTASGG